MLGISKDLVHRVWREAGIKPHRLERYMASNDPDFEKKASDIIGLYLNPPQHAAVFCVDEKSAIQALDRLDPVLPLSPGRAERHGFEYYRHGTLSLYAALDTKTGKVQGKTARRHTSAEFVAFLDELVSRRPAEEESISFWITFRPTKQSWCGISSLIIRTCTCISHRPTRLGSTKSKFVLPVLNANSSREVFSLPYPTWPVS